MKVKNFFNKLNSELNENLPKLTNDLKDMPIVTAEVHSQEQTVNEKAERYKIPFIQFFTPKRIGAFAVALLIVFASVFGVISFKGNKISDKAIVQIDINPSFQLVLNENMQVEKVVSLNSDGDIILSSSGFIQSIQGLPLKEATLKIAQKAEEFGFIDYKKDGTNGESNKITVTVSGNKEKLPNNLLKEVNGYVAESFKNSGIYLYVECLEGSLKNFDETFKEIQEQSQLYYQTFMQNASSFAEYAKNLVYEYCNSLLIHSLNKYYLYNEILSLNDQIKEHSANVLGFSYWVYSGDNQEINQIIAQMQEKLTQYNQMFNVDYTERTLTNEMAFGLASYSSDLMIEELENLAKQGVNESLFTSENGDLLTDFIIISAESFLSIAIETLATIVESSVEGLDAFVQELIVKTEGVLNDMSYSPELVPISNEEYNDFLNRIN